MTPKELVRAFHRAFVSRDVDALIALYADDAVNHQVAEEPLRGKGAIRRGFEEFFRAFPNETTEVLNLFEDGEWGIWEWRGGSADAPPGSPVVHGCGFFHVQGGKIVFQRGYWDKLTFLCAHGLPVPPQ